MAAPRWVALLFKSRRVIPSKPISSASPSLHRSNHPSMHQLIKPTKISVSNEIKFTTNKQTSKKIKEKKEWQIQNWIQNSPFFVLSKMAPQIWVSITQSIRQFRVQSREVHDLVLGFVSLWEDPLFSFLDTPVSLICLYFRFSLMASCVLHVWLPRSPNIALFLSSLNFSGFYLK